MNTLNMVFFINYSFNFVSPRPFGIKTLVHESRRVYLSIYVYGSNNRTKNKKSIYMRWSDKPYDSTVEYWKL